MQRFEFRLDSVLRLRELQLESENAKLQQLLGERQRLTNELEAIATERRNAKSSIYSLTNLENADLRTMSAFLLGLDARANTLRGRVQEMARSVDEQRQKVIQAERNVRLLEKLRARKFEQWKHEVDREIESIAQEAWISARHLQRSSELTPRTPSDVAPQYAGGNQVRVKSATRGSDSPSGSR